MFVPERIIDKAIKADCNDEDNVKLIIKVLKKLPFCKKGDVSTEHLEKVLNLYEMKYGYKLGVIIKSVNKKKVKYTITVINDKNIVEYIAGVTIWECFAKAAICMYWLQHREKG